MEMKEERSLAETPTWAVATLITILVTTGFLIHASLKKFGKWVDRTKRKHLFSALEKIKEELMLFGLLSLFMGHWTSFVAKICVRSSTLSSRFYPCRPSDYPKNPDRVNHLVTLRSGHFNSSISRQLLNNVHQNFCPENELLVYLPNSRGYESFASYESLEQLHRFLFVLGVTHVSYSFIAIALAMIKIYSWRTWENHAKKLAFQGLLSVDTSNEPQQNAPHGIRIRRLSTFIVNHTSHPWSKHRVFVWLLCFSRQFWSSINQADYRALRLGFITTHQLPFTYDFHNYMHRSMEEEFRDIVGISVPLWIFAISCVLLGFHGTNIYFWVSFLPAILILLVGTKLHRIVVKLAVEIMDSSQWTESRQFNLRDELFWFGSPRLLLRLIQFVSFQNAFEMAAYIWSLWEVKGPSCYTGDRRFLVIRLTFGVVSQIWCSFITFPLYVIITQMGSKFKKTIVSENVRKSLHGWRRKVKPRHGGPAFTLLTATSTASLDSLVDEEKTAHEVVNTEDSSAELEQNLISSSHDVSTEQCEIDEISPIDEKLHVRLSSSSLDNHIDKGFSKGNMVAV